MKFQPKPDGAGFLTIIRTTSALLLGNSVVIPVLTDGKAHYWWVLLLAGFICTIFSTIRIERN